MQDPSTMMRFDNNREPVAVNDETSDPGFAQAGLAVINSKKLQEDLQMIGMKIKQHEENIKFLKDQKNKLDESILDLQVILGNFHSSSTPKTENEHHSNIQSEEEITEQVLQREKTAAGILCQLKTRHGVHTSHMALTKDIVGIVATLGKVDDENLSRILSEYLGDEYMLAVVCRTLEGAKAFEAYDKEGSINLTAGLHGLGASIGKTLEEPFFVICLEGLTPYPGQVVTDDPQMRLDILKPKLPNGDCPAGFLGFAVNMIHVDSTNLCFVTNDAYGLRETLFYNLFSRLQVYRTRAEMHLALPFIKEGAVSLDGGMIKSNRCFRLGIRKKLNVRFPKPSSTSSLPEGYVKTELQIKELKFKVEKLLEDMKREQFLLDSAKYNFGSKKEEFVKFLAQSSSFVTQQQMHGRMMPR